jgi:hypothetical protein
MKKNTPLKLVILLSILFSFVSYRAQTEKEIMVFLTRICTNDSIKNTIGLPPNEGDSLLNFYFTPITEPTEGEELPLYEFDKYRVTFDSEVNLKNSKLPFAKITIKSYAETKCVILVEITNTENSEALNQWQHAFFNLDLSKGGRWYLTSVNYSSKKYAEPVIEVAPVSKKKGK